MSRWPARRWQRRKRLGRRRCSGTGDVCVRRARAVGRRGRGAGRRLRSRGRRRQRAGVATGVERSVGQDQADVVAGVVVREDRAHLAGAGGEVAARGAEVASCGEGGVADVERIGHTVAVAVRAPRRPGRRDELHRTDRPVECRVPVEAAVVGITDQRGSDAVQRRPDHRNGGQSVGQQSSSAELTVIGLHPADPSEQRPAQVAAGFGAIDLEGRPAIGRQCHRRDVTRTGNSHRSDAGHVARSDASSRGRRGRDVGLRDEPATRIDRR